MLIKLSGTVRKQDSTVVILRVGSKARKLES